MSAPVYLTSEEVAERFLRASVRVVHEHTRHKRIPFRRLPQSRRCLFLADEVRAWIDAGGQLDLETIELDGGLVVRPRQEQS